MLYGHGADPQHLLLPAHDFAAVLRNSGTNAVLTLDIDGKEQLALTKALDIHPIRRNIQHADLLVVRRGEKVTVEVNVVVEGEAVPGTLVTQDTNTIEIEADAHVDPRAADRVGRGRRRRHAVHRRLRSRCPTASRWCPIPRLLVVNVVTAPTAEDLEAEGAGEVAEEQAAEPPRAKRPPRAARAAARSHPSPTNPPANAGLTRHGRATTGGRPGQPRAATTPRPGTTSASSSPTCWPTASARRSRCTRSPAPRSSTGRLAGRSVVLAKPRIYMNESGRQVGPLAKFYSVPPADVDRHPRRARHRLRPHPAQVRWRRGAATTDCGRWRPRWAPRTFSGCASASAVRPAARIRRRSCWRTSPRPSARRCPTICEQAADATELLIADWAWKPAQNTVHAWALVAASPR